MTGVIKVDDIQDAGANSIVSSNGSGTLTLGSFTAPNITASTAILPDASDGAAIGSASLEWSDLFLADGAVINFGDDQEVTLTHVADTGLLISSTDKLMFNDASQFIQGTSATVLDIAATDEIELTATLIDVVGNLAVSGTLAQADAITMATNKKIIFRDAAIHISSTADGDLSIAADDEIDITSTLIDINGNVEISGTAVTTGVHTFTAVPVFPNNTIETADIQADAITAAKIADNAVVTAGINADAVTGAEIADDAINSEHYTDGSIDTAHIADGQVTIGKLATAVLTGATDIGAAIVDADLLLVDDGAGGTLRKTAASRLKTYIGSTGKILSITSLGDVGSLSQASTNSTDFADLGNLELQITPLASGSKFNIFINYNIDTGGDSHGLNVRLMFNHSGISHSEVNDRYGQSNTEVVADRINVWQSQNYFLAPNTTNEITFNLQIAAASSGQNTHFNRGTCSMIIMEYA